MRLLFDKKPDGTVTLLFLEDREQRVLLAKRAENLLLSFASVSRPYFPSNV